MFCYASFVVAMWVVVVLRFGLRCCVCVWLWLVLCCCVLLFRVCVLCYVVMCSFDVAWCGVVFVVICFGVRLCVVLRCVV